jgi:hypothetical protein
MIGWSQRTSHWKHGGMPFGKKILLDIALEKLPNAN